LKDFYVPETAHLLLPPVALASCMFAAIVRDTRGLEMDDLERFNHFPASPLIALTIVIEGDVRVVAEQADLKTAQGATPVLPISVTGPQTQPLTSWNSGPIYAIAIGFFPDAWLKLTGDAPETLTDQTDLELSSPLLEAVQACEELSKFYRSGKQHRCVRAGPSGQARTAFPIGASRLLQRPR
jgi:hypothetical protein